LVLKFDIRFTRRPDLAWTTDNLFDARKPGFTIQRGYIIGEYCYDMPKQRYG